MKHLKPKKLVLIGASTGGPGQIKKMITSLPRLHNLYISRTRAQSKLRKVS